MLHDITQVLALFLQPSSLALIAVAAGLLALNRRALRRRGAWLAWGGCAYLAVAGFSPLGNVLVLPLEQRFPRLDIARIEPTVAGLIIPGGGEEGRNSAGHQALALNEAAERITEGARLARLLPATRIVLTGGMSHGLPAADADRHPVVAFLTDMGIAADRIVVEGRSRNTHENALLTRDLLRPRPGQRWLLVTSAYHMPRAVGLFRGAGFDIVPCPVDFRTNGWKDMLRTFDDIPDGLARVDLAAKEWAGLLVNWLLGRTPALFPGPVGR